MTIFEHIKAQHAKVKGESRQKRWEYFWDYYKWHALIALLILVVVIQSIVGAAVRKDVAFSGILLNCKIGIEDEAFLQGFYDQAGIDGKKQEASFYTDLMLKDGKGQNDRTALQRIMAGVSTKDTDIIVGQTDSFRICAYSSVGIFADLRELLDKETLSKLEDRLYYIDGAVLEQLNAPVGTQQAVVTYPDPHEPESMQDPIPVGIDISDREDFVSAYYFPDTTLYIGVIFNTQRPELSRQFIDYLFS